MHSEAIRTNIPGATQHNYTELQRAYDFFNRELFDGRLPDALITITRKKGVNGYFWSGRFSTRADENHLDEISLNPTQMRKRDDRMTLSTLVHEMVHLWDQHFGKPGKGGYHGKSWADEMERVGLYPSDTAAPGGKRTGPKVSHYIVEGGPFDLACAKLTGEGFVIPYMERDFSEAEVRRAKAKKASKTKFCCPTCDAQAWGKPSLVVICGECEEQMEAEEK